MTTFEVWAPAARRMEIELPGLTRGAVRTMHRDGSRGPGWWTLEIPEGVHGTDYGFRIDDGDLLPDPRSRWQPAGIHGPSRMFDPARFRWTDTAWRGLPLAGAVLYELHIGTFTPDGTLDAAIDRLDDLAELGIDAVELLPVAAFSGNHGWGYDGVDLYAVHEAYGGPAALQRFVDACHARGMGVVLDVVYNHLGPSGNYLSRFGPYFAGKHSTPWGEGINLDSEGADEVRRWILDNVQMWLRDFHIDGLRLDAVHALADESATHLLEEMSAEVDALATAVGRPLFLVAESDLNDTRLITPREAGGYGLTGQWNDDSHHAFHSALTGERQGYYGDFGSLEAVATTLKGAFFHAGTWSSFRGRTHGRPVDRRRTPGHRFLAYLQNHDQIGNRAVGDRLSGAPDPLSPGLLRIGAALVLTSPFTPMLFMGEEWAASTPWQYFTDHQETELADAVRNGRRREFGSHGWAEEDVPDPQDPATFQRSKLNWDERDSEPHAGMLAWYRSLLTLRKSVPELADPRLDRVRVDFDEDERWLLVHRGAVEVACNLSDVTQTLVLDGAVTDVLLASDEGIVRDGAKLQLPPESVAVVRVG